MNELISFGDCKQKLDDVLFLIYEMNNMDCMYDGQLLKYGCNKYQMHWEIEYTHEATTIDIDLKETGVENDPKFASYLYLLQDEHYKGHLVILSRITSKYDGNIFSCSNHSCNYKNVDNWCTKCHGNPTAEIIQECLKKELLSCYSFSKHLESYDDFKVQVYKDVYIPSRVTMKQVLDCLLDNASIKDYYKGINFLENHPKMIEWNKIFREQYMSNRKYEIAFEFGMDRNWVLTFLRNVSNLMSQYESLEEQIQVYRENFMIEMSFESGNYESEDNVEDLSYSF